MRYRLRGLSGLGLASLSGRKNFLCIFLCTQTISLVRGSDWGGVGVARICGGFRRFDGRVIRACPTVIGFVCVILIFIPISSLVFSSSYSSFLPKSQQHDSSPPFYS